MKLLNWAVTLMDLDMKTLMGMLVWGNFALALLAFVFQRYHDALDNKNLIQRLGYTKAVQGIAWLLLFFRGSLSEWLSVGVGNTVLFVGFYLESILMLRMASFPSKALSNLLYRLQAAFLMLGILSFLFVEIFTGNPHIRIATSSLAIFLILVLPTAIYICDRNSSKFKKFLGAYLLLFVLSLIPRAIEGFSNNQLHIFSNTITQNWTYISLSLIMFITGTGFMLLAFEETVDRFRKSSELDPLTHIYNRRKFMQQAEAYFERHKRSREPLALLFLDIDHFKDANDHYGHSFGDEILIFLGATITGCIRVSDICCRYGGEEFVVLLPQTTAEQGALIGSRIREAVESAVFPGAPAYHCTVSLGVYADIPQSEDKLTAFIDKSDQAMYAAKQNGRNQVWIYRDPT